MTDRAPAICFASAISDAADTDAALESVLCGLTKALDGRADLALFFATHAHRPRIERIEAALARTLGATATLGTTCQGVIAGQREIEDGPGLAVLAGRLRHVHLQPFVLSAGQWAAVLQSPQTLRDHVGGPLTDLRALLVLVDPFSTPLMRLLDVMGQAYPGLAVIGGVASGAAGPGANHLTVNGRTFTDGVVGLALAGPIHVDCLVSQGCRPIGKPLVVTRAKRNVVMELGGRNIMPVIHDLAQTLDDDDRALVESNGLMIGRVINEYKDRFGRGDFLVRGIMGLDQDHGYMAIGDPQLRVGQTVQFHVRDARTAVEDLQMLLEGQTLHGPPAGVLLVSCNGRGTQLFEQPDVDARTIHQALGPAPLAGFFAAGEIGPVGGRSFLHGHTACLGLFRPPTRTREHTA